MQTHSEFRLSHLIETHIMLHAPNVWNPIRVASAATAIADIGTTHRSPEKNTRWLKEMKTYGNQNQIVYSEQMKETGEDTDIYMYMDRV